MNVIRQVCRRLAMDFGFSGWASHRYEVWVRVPGRELQHLDLQYWPASLTRKATRKAAIHWAWAMGLPQGGRIELVNLATGKHEVVRESVVVTDCVAELDAIRSNVLSYIDAQAPGQRFPRRSFLRGWRDCRKLVDRAFSPRVACRGDWEWTAGDRG